MLKNLGVSFSNGSGKKEVNGKNVNSCCFWVGDLQVFVKLCRQHFLYLKFFKLKTWGKCSNSFLISMVISVNYFSKLVYILKIYH